MVSYFKWISFALITKIGHTDYGIVCKVHERSGWVNKNGVAIIFYYNWMPLIFYWILSHGTLNLAMSLMINSDTKEQILGLLGILQKARDIWVVELLELCKDSTSPLTFALLQVNYVTSIE